MKIIVCIKQVPDTNEVRIDHEKGTLIREGVPSIMNNDDANALEQALRIKDENPDTSITLLTMGPPQAEQILLEGLAMGADEAILLSDRVFAGSDTWATSNCLSAAVKKIGDYDIIFAGRQAIDGDTAQVGPQLAEKLGIAQVTYVTDFSMNGDLLRVHRALEDGYEVLELKTPCLLTAIKELNEPRYMTISGIFGACRQNIIIWNAEDLGITDKLCGLEASPTNVFRSFTPNKKGAGKRIEGETPSGAAEVLIHELKLMHVI